MIEILILLFINSFLCFGFWNACLYIPEKVERNWTRTDCHNCFKVTQEEVKGVLWRLELWASDKWFYKPLCGCLPCMASIHSIYPYWLFAYYTDEMNLKAVLFYPIYIVALSGVNYLIDSIR